MRTILLIAMLTMVVSCGTDDTTGGTTGLRFNSAADFSASASSLVQAVTTAACAEVANSSTQDEPQLRDGLDCDNDGGIVAHITPSQYSIAFKRVTLLAADGGDNIDFIPDTGTLALSETVDFTSADSSETVITIVPDDLTAGTFSGIEAELYYFQLTFPVSGTTRNVRIYMSDDDFAAEGSLGHHQGDITFIGDDGMELGWIDENWNDTLVSERGEAQNGAGGRDAQTGHDRGFFGNSEFWGQTVLNQESGQDIFILSVEFDESLTIPDPSTITALTTITATFSVADTFFYEDFAPQGTGFAPGSGGGEATAESTAWAPLAPEVTLAISEE